MTLKLGTILRPPPPTITLHPSSSSVVIQGAFNVQDHRQKINAALPFFRDPSHTVPVKWGLYRPLLKRTKGVYPSIRREIRDQWKRWKGITSVLQTKGFLEEYHTLLDHLSSSTSSSSSPTSANEVNTKPTSKSAPLEELRELEGLLGEKHRAADLVVAQRTELQSAKIKSIQSPRLTGGFHRPTLFNPPLPRMKPQPIGISMMIQNRLRKRERRHARRKVWASLLNDMKLEVSFWKDLERESASSSTNPTWRPESESGSGMGFRQKREESDWTKGKDARCPGGWDGPIQEELRLMDVRFRKENSRAESMYSEELMERVTNAKSKRKERRKAKALDEKDKKKQSSINENKPT
ncbi:hypothetical protein IAT40_005561 [Kwoniella sp. CBS 6097]